MLFNKKTFILILFQTGLFGALFAETNWSVYNTDNSLIGSNQINCLAINENKLWVGTSYGLFSFENESWENYSEALPNQNVKCISFDEAGKMFVGTLSGLAIYDGVDWEVYTDQNSILSNQVNDVAFVLDQTYIATIDGLFKLGDELSLVLDSSSLEASFLNARTLYSFGDSLIIGTINGGLGYFYNDSVVWHNTITSQITDNSILGIGVDQNKNVWLGAPYAGLTAHLESGSWLNYNTISNDSWPSNSLNTILMDDDNFMFVGSNGAGFFRFYINSGIPNTTIYNTSNSGLPNDNVLSIAKENAGIYWIGTENGLVRWDHSVEVAPYSTPTFYFNNSVSDQLIISENSNVEIYNLNGQLVCFENNKKNIGLSYLASGMYILRLNGENHRIIKE